MRKPKKTAKPLVSIIINCYNGEEYLSDALDSVLRQTFADWEIIFWDNCSIDGSRFVIKRYSDTRIKYFLAPKHTDLGRARTLAVAQATGDWIGFLDVDDYWYPKKLQLQVDTIMDSEKNVGLIYGRCETLIVTNDGISQNSIREIRPAKRLPQGDLSKEILDGNFLPSPSILYRASALRECAPATQFQHAPDYYFSVYISQKYLVKAVDEIICVYRKHSKNLSLEKEQEGYLEGLFVASSADPEQLIPNAHIARCIIYFARKNQICRALRIVKEFGLYNVIRSTMRLLNFKRIY